LQRQDVESHRYAPAALGAGGEEVGQQRGTDMASPAVRVAAIGGGSFGTCIARLVATAVAKRSPAAAAAAVTVPPPAVSPLELGTPLLDPTVRLWVRRDELAEEINTRHTNSQYLSASARLPQNIVASTSLEKVAAGADVVILGVPHQFLPQLLPELSLHTSPSTQIVSLVKSFDYNPDTSELSSLAERISGCENAF
jgi:glycerol-3-phosphate dehydrogenase